MQFDDRRALSSPTSGGDVPSGLLELYGTAVEMADRVSAHRALANTFFLTVNTALVAIVGSASLRWYVPAAGILFAATWWVLLKSYRDLNSAKFAVILEIEKQLPVRIYGDEWKLLKKEPVKFAPRRETLRSWAAQYRELGRVERVVPVVFAGIYCAELLRQALS
jgi:hypothetical protein